MRYLLWPYGFDTFLFIEIKFHDQEPIKRCLDQTGSMVGVDISISLAHFIGNKKDMCSLPFHDAEIAQVFESW